MQKIFLYLLLLWLPTGCKETPYRTLAIANQEIIPGYCSAWTDGCNIYCRVKDHNQNTESNKIRLSTNYQTISIKDNCKDSDIQASTCIDEDPEKLERCYELEDYVKK